MKTLRDLGPGDEVAVIDRSARRLPPRIVRIERVTAAQIAADDCRWHRESGQQIPRSRLYPQHIEPATDAHRHVVERVDLLRVIDRALGGHDRYRLHRQLSTNTLRTIAAALRDDPATEGA